MTTAPILHRQLDAILAANSLTVKKAELIAERDQAKVCGFVLELPGGTFAVVSHNAVRWIKCDEHFKLMHPE